MKAKFCGSSDESRFIHGHIYEVLDKSDDLYYIVDETGDKYLYSLKNFCIMNDNENNNK
ncbi:hypothetical protein [Paenibacillus sp. LHD-38]|uniref:hypothetical protein n=1 Tax=Paenibacillus sp. LHD-38 TaxID=3072143 RepID=UPI00280CC46D|nr:hypothetical protein [Paenibacillus sp. LHD-38]MDQ8734253.1 hypothetical protein [Paenibacillus sp. LHD-38]